MILVPDSYLTSHIYFMLFLSLSCVAPPHISIRDSLFPHWLVDDNLPAQEVGKVDLIILIPVKELNIITQMLLLVSKVRDCGCDLVCWLATSRVNKSRH